jgi:hypothetical protein
MIKSVVTKEGSHAAARFLSRVAFVWALFLVTTHGLAQSTTAPTLTPFQQSLVNARSSAPNTTFPLVVPTIDPFYAGSYSAVDLGVVPTRIVAAIGALTFKDSNTLLVDVNTYQATAELDAVTVTRGTGGHITGFSGTGTLFANAPYVDGGLQYGPGGVLFYTAFGPNQLVQFKPGSANPDLYTDLTPLGVPYSVGSLAFVPPGFGGAGQLKLISWNAETWYNTYLSPNGSGTFTVGPTSSPATALPPVNWEGIAFVAAGQPLFAVNSVLINADLSNAVYSFTVDTSGNPITSTQKHFMDVGDPVGMTVDPMTGDLLITTEQGPTARHITLVKGFTPTTPPPAATATTSKGTYNPGEAIVVNFSNASGSAHDWIGLYPVGAPNTGYLQWFYTDGTQVGTAGITSGSVTFPSGLANVGSYEARLFFNRSYALQASVAFAVQNGPPGQATNPNPAANATGVVLSPTLSWTAGAGATSHTVYFGTNPTPGAAELKGSQAGTSYSPGALTGLTTYYWRIDEVNKIGTTTGVVWSFTTGNPATLPTVTTSKGTYLPGQAIVVNFSNASGSAHDWIGLFAAGGANTAYLQWFYTDGTQMGTAGIISGSVTFPSGLPNVGSYEARLFFNRSYTPQASVAFGTYDQCVTRDVSFWSSHVVTPPFSTVSCVTLSNVFNLMPGGLMNLGFLQVNLGGALGLFWGNPIGTGGQGSADDVCIARKALAKELIAAIANVTLLNPDSSSCGVQDPQTGEFVLIGTLIAEAQAATQAEPNILDCSTPASQAAWVQDMNTLTALLNIFNGGSVSLPFPGSLVDCGIGIANARYITTNQADPTTQSNCTCVPQQTPVP